MRDAFAAHSAARATHEQLRQQYEGMRIDRLIASWATPGSYVGAALLGSPSGDQFVLAHRQLTAQAEEVARTRRLIQRLRSEMRRDEIARETIAECAARRQRALVAMGRSAPPPAAPATPAAPAAPTAGSAANQTFEMRLFHVNADGSLGGAGYVYRLRFAFAATGAITGDVLSDTGNLMGQLDGQMRATNASGRLSIAGLGLGGNGVWQLGNAAGQAPGMLCMRSQVQGSPITKRIGIFWRSTAPPPSLQPADILPAAQLC